MSIKNLKKRRSDHGFTDSGEASSGPSTAKNFKYISEELNFELRLGSTRLLVFLRLRNFSLSSVSEEELSSR
jgi:hypothetical protein